MSKNRELAKFAQAPQITFQNGIMDTDDDAVLGFVQDLTNMEIENGSAQARSGTRRLNDFFANMEYMKSYTIAGVDVLFGIQSNGRMYAWVEAFPEIDLLVCRHGYDNKKSYLTNVAMNSNGTTVYFPNGSKFMSDEDDRYIYFLDDSAMILRIDKRGFFRIKKVHDNITTQSLLADMDSVRDRDAATSFGLYLTIEDASHDRLNTFYVIDDISERTVPIAGAVRCAYVNDAGFIGKWSDPAILPEYKSCYISAVPGVSIDRTNPWAPYIRTDYLGLQTTTEAEALYVTRVVDGSWFTAGTTFNYNVATAFTTTYPANGSETVTLYVDSDNRRVRMFPEDLDMTGGEYRFFKLNDIKVLNPIDSAGSYVDSGSLSSTAMFTNIGDLNVTVKNFGTAAVVTSWDSANSVAYTPQALTVDNTRKSYELDIENDSLFEDSFYPYPAEYTINDSSGAPLETFNGRICTARVDFHYDFPDKVLPNTAQKFATLFDESNTGCVYANRFNNVWENISAVKELNSTQIVKVKTQEQKIYLDVAEDMSFGDIVLSTSAYTFMDGGKRFAVYNNNKLLGVSQKAVRNDNTNYEIMYNISPSAVDGSAPINAIRSAYVPVVALDMQSVKPFYNINESSQPMRNPREFVMNNGVGYVLDGNELWLADRSMLMQRKIDVDFDIFAIDRFQRGAVLSTSKGLYFIDSNGSYNLITNAEGLIHKSSTSGGGGVYIIDKRDDVWLIKMQNVNGAIYPTATIISKAINNVQWGAFPKIHFCDDTLWIAREEDIYGFKDGIWAKRYDFSEPIKTISSLNDKLTISIINKFSITGSVDSKIIQLAEGSYEDDLKINTATGTAIDMYEYIKDTGGTYYYDESNLSFTIDTSVGGDTYIRNDPEFYPQENGTSFTSSFDTIDIWFDNKSITSNNIEFFIRSVTSLSNAKINWTSDSNLSFNLTNEPTIALRASGSTAETCSYSNPTVTMGRTRKITIKEIKTQVRNAECVKFKVTADYSDGNDIFRIQSIEINPSGFIFKYGDS